MSYYFCNKCRCKHPIDLGCPQTLTNRTMVVPEEAMNNYELALAVGAIPSDTTLPEYLASLKGEPGVDGKDGQGINIKGNLPSYAALLAIPNPQPGDSYAVLGATDEDQALLYTYDEENGWPDEGEGVPIQGEKGDPGTDGDTLIPEITDNYFDI